MNISKMKEIEKLSNDIATELELGSINTANIQGLFKIRDQKMIELLGSFQEEKTRFMTLNQRDAFLNAEFPIEDIHGENLP